MNDMHCSTHEGSQCPPTKIVLHDRKFEICGHLDNIVTVFTSALDHFLERIEDKKSIHMTLLVSISALLTKHVERLDSIDKDIFLEAKHKFGKYLINK